jgi:hypothetical protein
MHNANQLELPAPLVELVTKLVDAVEAIGNQTANLISSGDPIAAIDEEPGSSAIAGDLRHTIRAMRESFDRAFRN